MTKTHSVTVAVYTTLGLPSTDCKYEPRFCSSRFVKSSNVIDAVNTSQLKLITIKMQMLRSVTYLSSKTSRVAQMAAKVVSCVLCTSIFNGSSTPPSSFACIFCDISSNNLPCQVVLLPLSCLRRKRRVCRRLALSIRLNINV